MPNLSKEFKTLIEVSDSPIPIVISLESLICSLYTLFGNHEVFKKINLSSDLYLNLKNIDYFSNSQRIENLNEMKNLFNNSSLKQFAFYLTLNIGLDNETNLLKKYLRKFKRNYKCYFFYQNGTYVNLPTDKEINLYAIDSLFLLTGI